MSMGYKLTGSNASYSGPGTDYAHNVGSMLSNTFGEKSLALLSLDDDAVRAGASAGEVQKLVDAVNAAGFGGLMADYEPKGPTAGMAVKYAAMLKAIAAPMQSAGLLMGMDISSWGILGANDFKTYADVGLDIYMSMASHGCTLPHVAQTSGKSPVSLPQKPSCAERCTGPSVCRKF
eukprot:Hpha_TRINITY_DN14415_c0_g1::TRINITY_DN14415_c0_g1_i1::g.157865::m.157865